MTSTVSMTSDLYDTDAFHGKNKVSMIQLLGKPLGCTHSLIISSCLLRSFTCVLIYLSSALQQAPISTESCLPTQLSLTHAPYVPQFIHVAPDTHVFFFLQVSSTGLRVACIGILNSPRSATAAATPVAAHSTQPAIIKQTGLFVTSWFTHQQVIFSDFAMDGFALLTLNKNSSPKNAA